MYVAGLTLGVAAIVGAFPTANTATTPSDGFGVAILADEKYYSINAVVNCSAKELLLMALPIDIYPGTLGNCLSPG